MRNDFAAIALGLAVCLVGGTACAMTSSAGDKARCQVAGADLLPPGSGGSDALCGAIVGALPDAAARGVSVEVRVLSPHLMAATTTLADGSRMPEVKTARSDRPLGRRSFQMLADALAAQLAAYRK